jgi:hypothetical protein
MTIGRIIGAVICAGSVFSARAGPGDANLVRNADFSRGLEHWQVTFLEPNEKKYHRNHEWVEVVSNPDGPGKCLQFSIPPAVAASEGVKAVTPLMPIETGVQYEFGADVWTSGTALIIFIEGYREDPEQQTAGDNFYPGYRRIYRKTIQFKGGPGKWQTARAVAAPPKRYQPTHVLIKLYAYYPAGTVRFRNVVLRPAGRIEGYGSRTLDGIHEHD